MRIDWLEIDGRRVSESDIHRSTEYRCDSCGKFLAEPVVLQATLFIAHQVANLPQYHLHHDCARERLPFILADLASQGTEL